VRPSKVIDVAAYGAVPDDGLDDVAAMQAAIDAAGAMGDGAIVRFDVGVYDLNVDATGWNVLRLNSDNVVLQGVGSGPKGAILKQHRMDPDPNYWTNGSYVITAGSSNAARGSVHALVENAARGARAVTVANTSNLAPGSVAVLRMVNPSGADALSRELTAPLKPD
jgi:polygalacturonase